MNHACPCPLIYELVPPCCKIKEKPIHDFRFSSSIQVSIFWYYFFVLSIFQVNGIKILDTLPCTFDKLKSLKLFMHFCELPPILLVFCFLRRAPNLQKLKIRVILNIAFQIFLLTFLDFEGHLAAFILLLFSTFICADL